MMRWDELNRAEQTRREEVTEELEQQLAHNVIPYRVAVAGPEDGDEEEPGNVAAAAAAAQTGTKLLHSL